MPLCPRPFSTAALRRLPPLAALSWVLTLMPNLAAAQAADASAARSLAATCASCHGTQGVARGGDMKTLAGRPAASIVASMAAFQRGDAPATVMHQIAKGYTDEQIQRIATYFSAQPASR